jgi:hypothetical protein
MDESLKRRGRGLGKKPAMVYLPIRVDKEVVDFFDTYYPSTRQAKIREILNDFINKQRGHYEKENEQNAEGDSVYEKESRC